MIGRPWRPRTAETILARSIPEPNSGCWIWLGAVNAAGYGYATEDDGRSTHAHRLAWRIWYGAIPEGGVVRHSCDTPSCVNPDHLRLGSQRDNVQDMLDRGRKADVRGSLHPNAKLTEDAVREMRRRAPGLTFAQLGRMFGIGGDQASLIVRGKAWRHVEVRR